MSGDWIDATRWSTAVFPTNGTPTGTDSYDVTIDAVGSAYMVSVNQDITIDALHIDSPDATFRLLAGRLDIVDGVNVQDGTWELRGGEVVTPRIDGSASGSVLVPRQQVVSLHEATLATDLHIESGGIVNVVGSLRLEGATILMKDILNRGGPKLVFEGTQTLGGVGTVTMDFVNSRILPRGGGVFTIGSDVTIESIRSGGLGANEPTDVASDIINEGTIIRRPSNDFRRILVGSSHGRFINRGLIRASGNGVVELLGDWTNEGVIDLTQGGLLTMQGTYTTDDFGTLIRDGAPITLGGTLDNRGRTLSLDDRDGEWILRGTILGGTIDVPDASSLRISRTEFDGVTLASDLAINDFGTIAVVNDLLLDDSTIYLRGGPGSSYVSRISVEKTERLRGNGEIIFDGVQSSIEGRADASLTLEPGITIRTQNNAGTVGAPGFAIINQGALLIEPGGTMMLDGPWTNQGTITVDNGTLNLGGQFDWTELGTFLRRGGEVNLSGQVDLGGQTMLLTPALGNWNIRDAVLRNGTITDAGGRRLELAAGDDVTFDNIALDMPFEVKPNSKLTILRGLTVRDELILDGWVTVTGSHAIDGDGTIVVGNESKPTIELVGGLVTIGPELTIAAGVRGGQLGRNSTERWRNRGTLLVDSPTGELTLGGQWSNEGVIRLEDGRLDLAGEFRGSDIGTIERNGGTLRITGTLDNRGSVMTFDPALGPWTFGSGSQRFGTILGGTVRSADDSELDLGIPHLQGVLLVVPVRFNAT